MEPWTDKTVLIVDDMPKVVEKLTRLYESLGLKVVGSAANGIEAISKVKSLRPQLVSMDIIMPEMDGVECFRRIRDSEEMSSFRPQVFFLSYLATEPKVLEAYRQEIPEYLFVAKNYSAELLRNCLGKLLMGPGYVAPPNPAFASPRADLVANQSESET